MLCYVMNLIILSVYIERLFSEYLVFNIYPYNTLSVDSVHFLLRAKLITYFKNGFNENYLTGLK